METAIVSPAQHFDQLVNSRRATRAYDQTCEFDHSAVERGLDRARLAPSSSNMQLWEFYRVRDPKKMETLSAICLGQKSATTANELVVFVVRLDKFRPRAAHNLAAVKAQFAVNNDLHPKLKKRTLKYYQKLMPQLYFNDPLRIWGSLKRMLLFFAALGKPMVRQANGTDMRIVGHKSCALAAMTFMFSMEAEGYSSCPLEGVDTLRIKRFLGLPYKAEICMVVSTGKAVPEGIYGDRIRVPREEVVFEV
jgi:nitroreductase